MIAGRFNKRIQIQQQTTAADAAGTPLNIWTTVATVWASVEPLSGREYFGGAERQAQVSTRIRMRYMAGVLPRMRVVYAGRWFDVLSVIDGNESHRELELMCNELVERPIT